MATKNQPHVNKENSQKQRPKQPDSLDTQIKQVNMVATVQRALTGSPSMLKPVDALALQRVAGNRAVQQMLVSRTGERQRGLGSPVIQRMLVDRQVQQRLNGLGDVEWGENELNGIKEMVAEYEELLEQGALTYIWDCYDALQILQDLMKTVDEDVEELEESGDHTQKEYGAFYKECLNMQRVVRLERVRLVDYFTHNWRVTFAGLPDYQKMLTVRREMQAHDEFIALLSDYSLKSPQANLNRLSLKEFSHRYQKKYGHPLEPSEDEGQTGTIFDLTTRGRSVPQDDRGLEDKEHADERNERFFHMGQALAYTFHMSTCTALTMYSELTHDSYLKHVDAATSTFAIANEIREFLNLVSENAGDSQEEDEDVHPWDSIKTTLYLGSTAHTAKDDKYGSAAAIEESIKLATDDLEGVEGFLKNVKVVEGKISSDMGSHTDSYVVVGGGGAPRVVNSGHEYTIIEAVLGNIVNGETENDLDNSIVDTLKSFEEEAEEVKEVIPPWMIRVAWQAAGDHGMNEIQEALEPFLE